ncbi:hypothetical protein YTPLAS18_31890 [Nitrospira sp.]|nr:hypothetical protein YTPLAS18_31890 [Nitrospira sp.]
MRFIDHRALRLFGSLAVLAAGGFIPTNHPAAASEYPAVLIATAAPSERTRPGPTWGEELARSFETYLNAKYPQEQIEPYTQTVDRIRDAVQRGDRWAARRETGVLLKMLTDRAYGLERGAARDLMGMAQRLIPDDEFGIVFPYAPACHMERGGCP